MGKMKECFSKLEGAGGSVWVSQGYIDSRAWFTNGLSCRFTTLNYEPAVLCCDFYIGYRHLKATAFYGENYVSYYTGGKPSYISKWGVARRIYNKINLVS